MSRQSVTRRFPVLARRAFRLLLADRMIAPWAMAFSMVGVSFARRTQYGAAALIAVVSALALIPRDIREMKATDNAQGPCARRTRGGGPAGPGCTPRGGHRAGPGHRRAVSRRRRPSGATSEAAAPQPKKTSASA